MAAAPLGIAILAGAAGGAASAAASNVTSQVLNNGALHNFSIKSLAKNIIIGGLIGGVTAGLGKGIQALKAVKAAIEMESLSCGYGKNITSGIGESVPIPKTNEELLQFAQQNHCEALAKFKNKNSFHIDFKDEILKGDAGATLGSPASGITDIYVVPEVMDDSEKLFTVLGHEIEHGSHFNSFKMAG